MRESYWDVPTRSVVSLSKDVDYESGFERWWVNRVSVLPAHRGRGLARRLMGETVEAADLEGAVLCLNVQPDLSGTGLDRAALTAWYGRLGFVSTGVDPTDPDQDREPEMVRWPKRGQS